MKAVLDTSLPVTETLSHPGYDVVVASISWAELGYGVRKTTDAVERARREVRAAVITRNLDDFAGLDGLLPVIAA